MFRYLFVLLISMLCAAQAAASDEGDEYEDMEGFEDNDILVDDAAAATSSTQEEESNLLKTRTVSVDCCTNG